LGTDQIQVDGAQIMTFGYAQPFSFKITPAPPLTVAGVRHGVTEITLSDGRVVRAKLEVKGVKPNPKKPGALEIAYAVVTEVVSAPAATTLEAHQTLQ
jgi:hypothetical protein